MTAGFETLDFHQFHCGELPRRLRAGHGALAAGDAAEFGPLAFRLDEDGTAYTYRARRGEIEIVPGEEDAATVVGLGRESWEGLVHDLESPAGLLYAGRARAFRGDAMRFVGWEPALRAMYTGRPIYDASKIDLRDRQGRPLDPSRAFRLDDDTGEMAHFLRTAGYILVRGVFGEQEIETLRSEAAALHEQAVEGDHASWWGRKANGESVLCRVLHAGVMPAMHGLYRDPRLMRIAALAEEDLRPTNPDEVDGVTVLWKKPGVVEGLGDLPWHRDCGMGGHALNCPCLVMSIFLWPASPESGDLRFLPGSHRYSYRFADAREANLPGAVGIGSRAGDVSIHYGDVVHGAPPPTAKEGPFRASVLIGYKPPHAAHHRGERHYNDVLIDKTGGRTYDLRQVASQS